MKYILIGLLLGLLHGVLVYLAERTTGAVHWPLVVSFPICLTIAGYCYWKGWKASQ
jgi:hypothetical protein